MTDGWFALVVLSAVAAAPQSVSESKIGIQLAGGPSTKTFAVSIDGTADASIVAACLVNTGTDIEIVTLMGAVPQIRTFAATGVSCQIQKIGQAGRIDVQIKRDGRTVSRSQSSGQSGVISVSVQ